MSAGAVPPLPGGHRPGDRSTCRVNGEALGRRVASLRAQARGAAPLAPPSPLTPTVYVLRVDFSGTAMSASLATTRNFFQQVQDYYVENSYGVFVPTFTVSPVVYTLAHTLAYYGDNSGALCSGINDVTCGVGELFADATTAAAAVDFSPYDHLMIYHAGDGEESTASPPVITANLWSLFIPDTNNLSGKQFSGFTLVPESERAADALGVICHEYGHQLGLPDLYDTYTGKATIGTWELMDYPWAGIVKQGDNPPHLGAWCKKFLGFGTVQPILSTGIVTFLPVETNGAGIHQLALSGQEYFLGEYRLRSTGTYDAALPQSAGLALWHVDDAVALNPTILSNNWVNAPNYSGTHRGVDMVEADGVEADPFGGDPGFNNAFVDGETAAASQTDLYNGQASSLAVTNINGAGTGAMQATISFILATNGVSVGKVRGYPNPSGGRYPARAGAPTGTLATLRFELTRPVSARDLRMDIYALDGGRVRSIGGSGFRFREDISENFNWIYEFDWDGKNESGDDVGSGVYLIHLDADGHTVNGKLAVER